MRTRHLLFTATLAVALLVSGCLSAGQAAQPELTPTAAPPAVTPPAVPVEGVDDFASLVDCLRQQGLRVQPVGQVSQPFFGVPGQVIRVDDGEVQVFVYASEEAAQQDAAKVSPDGGTIDTTMVTWVAPPHFYRRGNLLVIYLGGEPTIQKALADALGPQFAGG